MHICLLRSEDTAEGTCQGSVNPHDSIRAWLIFQIFSLEGHDSSKADQMLFTPFYPNISLLITFLSVSLHTLSPLMDSEAAERDTVATNCNATNITDGVY